MSLRPSTFDEALKLFGALGALLSFAWGVWVWRDQSETRLAQAKAESESAAESRRVEATTPFLERQLRRNTEAAQVAAPARHLKRRLRRGEVDRSILAALLGRIGAGGKPRGRGSDGSVRQRAG